MPKHTISKNPDFKALEELDLKDSTFETIHESTTSCKVEVARIACNCRKLNLQYQDGGFDIESDIENCLQSIDDSEEYDVNGKKPMGVKRVKVRLPNDAHVYEIAQMMTSSIGHC